MKKITAIVGLAAAFALSVSVIGCSRFHHTEEAPPSTVTPPVVSAPATPTAAPDAATPKYVIYLPSTEGGGDHYSLTAQTISLVHPQSPARDALKALIDAPQSPLPSGTELRGIKIEDHLATVDFSRQFKSNFHGSDTQEAQAINAILSTLGQFPSIEQVQLLVDGKPVESIGGTLTISGPLDVIRPDDGRQARAPKEASHG